MRREPIYTPGQLVVGRRPVLCARDLDRVREVVADSRSLLLAARRLGVGRTTLHRFVTTYALPRRHGRPRALGDVHVVVAALAGGSLTGAARALGVDRLTLRRFAAAHRLTLPDGRRRR